ncbi:MULTISPECIES: hypothetical protein [unclassified Enterococcus]|uniref:hypothetical protein n=1 Tax=unclassified Enterococcus TaxID=2608891 RepID=UPI003F28C00F
MEQKKSRLDLLRDRVEDFSIVARRYQSLIYFVWFIIVVLSYSLMIGLNIFLSDDVGIVSTKLNSELEFGNTTYVLVDRQVNKAQRSATFLLGSKELDSVYDDRTWHVSVEYQNGSDDSKIQTEIYSGEDGFTYVQVEGLASEWSGIRISLSMQSDAQVDEQQDYIVVGEEAVQSNQITFQSKKDVQLLSIDYAIEQREKQIDKDEKLIADNEKLIEKNKVKIQSLEADMVYQTETQQAETQTAINQLEEQNRQFDATNFSIGKQNEELQKQIQKLEEKAKSIENDEIFR